MEDVFITSQLQEINNVAAKLRTAVATSSPAQKALNECNAMAKQAGANLQLLAIKSPFDAAEFLDIKLIRNDEGEVARLPNGEIKGYRRFIFGEVEDSNLRKVITSWTKKQTKSCNLSI